MYLALTRSRLMVGSLLVGALVLGGGALAVAGALPSSTDAETSTVAAALQQPQGNPAQGRQLAATHTPTPPAKLEAASLNDLIVEDPVAAASNVIESKLTPKGDVGPESKSEGASSIVHVQGTSSRSVEGGPATDGSSSEPEVAAKGSVYIWHDGDREMRAILQNDVPKAIDTGHVKGGSDPVQSVQDGSKDNGSEDEAILPVFQSESGGGEMTLPGGVVLLLDESWTEAEVDGFFTKNNIKPSQLTKMEFLDNAYLVDTEAGFPALELANELVGQDGVLSSSPNWRRERVGK